MSSVVLQPTVEILKPVDLIDRGVVGFINACFTVPKLSKWRERSDARAASVGRAGVLRCSTFRGRAIQTYRSLALDCRATGGQDVRRIFRYSQSVTGLSLISSSDQLRSDHGGSSTTPSLQQSL